MPPRYVKPYVKRNKNDAADAEAICEAVTRPNMRFVPIKTADQQSILMLHRTRMLFIRQRTMTINAVRAHLAEYFIAGLIRAANEVEKLHGEEARRLLNRAITVIRDMRETIGIPRSRTAADVVIDLQTTAVALGLGNRSPEQVKAALLDAAGIIRDLHIVLDTGTEIQIDRK
jgi:hypothetical protein